MVAPGIGFPQGSPTGSVRVPCDNGFHMKTDTFPRTLTEFKARFVDEKACLTYLRQVKWPEGFRCTKCGGKASWLIEPRQLDECKACGKQHSLTAGTIFEGTRKPIRMWFRAITLFVTSKRSLSAKELSRQS